MLDIFADGLRAVSAHGASAPALVFGAGALSSIGPCGAPRSIAIAGVVARSDRAQASRLVATFVAGLICAYALYGAAATLLARASEVSSITYALIAVGLAVAGWRTLWSEEHECAHVTAPKTRGFGAVFLLGASFALVVSPCCTPLVAGIVAYTGASGDPLYGSALLACFALGHTLPLCGAAAGANALVAALQRASVQRAAAVVSGTLMLALAGYYGVLA